MLCHHDQPCHSDYLALTGVDGCSALRMGSRSPLCQAGLAKEGRGECGGPLGRYVLYMSCITGVPAGRIRRIDTCICLLCGPSTQNMCMHSIQVYITLRRLTVSGRTGKWRSRRHHLTSRWMGSAWCRVRRRTRDSGRNYLHSTRYTERLTDSCRGWAVL